MTANRTSYVYVGLAAEKSGESCSTDAQSGPNEPRRQTQCGRALASASVSRVLLCREQSAGECVDRSIGYAQVRGKKRGRFFTSPRLLIRESLVRAQPGDLNSGR